jgi:hypothetical protein
MTQLDELLRQHSQRIPVDDLVEREALNQARHTLRAAGAHQPAHVLRRRPPRHLARLALIVGLAAGIAAVVALFPGGTGNQASQLGPATASAKSLLQRAARAISHRAWQPLGPGQYFYYRELDSVATQNRPAGSRPTEIQDVWVGANGFARIVQTGPDTVIAGGDVLIFHATAEQLNAERQRQRHGAHLRILAYPQKYIWGAGADYQQLIHLPTDPSKLQRYIEQHATGGGPRFSDIFSLSQNLLNGAPLPPKVSAAMYHVIARLPGMRLIGPARDPLGRRGVAIGLFFNHQPGRIELILDPTTGVLLGQRGIALVPKQIHAPSSFHGPAGSIVNWTAIDRQGVVTSDHQTPTTSPR